MINKYEETQKKGRNTLIAILIIGVAVYLGFTPLFNLINGGVAGAVVGSSFGAIFVIVLTMYLLNKQTEIEQESKRSERVFDEKVQLYKEILNTTKDIVKDMVITSQEINKLPFIVMKLQMLGGDDAIDKYQEIASTINKIFYNEENEDGTEKMVVINEDEKNELHKEMITFTRYCRVDLGISKRIGNDELFNRSIETIKKANKVTQVNDLIVDEQGNPEKHIAEAEIELNEKKLKIRKYKKSKIRIFIGDKIMPNSMAILRMINSEHNLVEDEFFKGKNTQNIGSQFIKLINDQ